MNHCVNSLNDPLEQREPLREQLESPAPPVKEEHGSHSFVLFDRLISLLFLNAESKHIITSWLVMMQSTKKH